LLRLRSQAQTFLAAGVLAVAAGAAVHSFWFSNTHLPSQAETARLLEASLPDASGSLQALDQWKGKVLVVNFWATWCAPCREEMPDLARLQARYEARGVQLVGVAIDEKKAVQEFLQRTPVSYPVLIGGYEATRLSEKAGNTRGGLPYTLVIDRRGTPIQSYLGQVDVADLDRTLARLL
jgi:thiol-disulfide isomerase/thioredoxin